MTLLVAKFRNKRHADMAALYIQKMKEKVKLMKAGDWEDFYLGQMIEEGRKEKGTVSLAAIRKKLRA